MPNRITYRVLAAVVLTLGCLGAWRGERLATAANAAPATSPKATATGTTPADDARRAQIKALGDQIRALREDYKSQTAPLEAQIKSLREKFEPQLASLEAQRKALVEESESPELRALTDEEASQLAALADREKDEIAKVRERYAEQKKAIQQTFQRRREELETQKR